MATDNLVKTEKKELLDIILLVFLMAFTILIVFPVLQCCRRIFHQH